VFVCLCVHMSVSAAHKGVRRLSSLNKPTGLCTLLFTHVGACGHSRKGHGEEGNRGVAAAMMMMECLQI